MLNRRGRSFHLVALCICLSLIAALFLRWMLSVATASFGTPDVQLGRNHTRQAEPGEVVSYNHILTNAGATRATYVLEGAPAHLYSPITFTPVSTISLPLVSRRWPLPPPSFSIAWPFPRDSQIGGINYFDHDQAYNFDPRFNDSNGLALSYFCRERTNEWEIVEGSEGAYFVGQVDGHRGNDFYLPVGTPLLAAGDGIALMEEHDPIVRDRVKILHDNGWVTIYAHNSRRDESLHNTRVRAGDPVAVMTAKGGGHVEIGGVTYWEMHFEVHRPNPDNASGYSSVDPYFGRCSNRLANPEQTVYFIDGAPLDFLPGYFDE